jgi:hypothetical protein
VAVLRLDSSGKWLVGKRLAGFVWQQVELLYQLLRQAEIAAQWRWGIG